MTSKEIGGIGQLYIACMRAQVAAELQMQKLEEHALTSRGLATREKLTEEERASHDFKKTKLNVKPEDEEKVKEVLKELKESRGYLIFSKSKAVQLAEQKRLLAEAEDFFGDSAIWKFCERVRGLSSVAALTFFTAIDTDTLFRLSGGSRVITAGKVWAYCGYKPGQKLVSGELGGYNTVLKGRLWMVSSNTVKANDPYYAEIYRIQKELYKNRPDLVAMNGYVLKMECGHFVATQQKIAATVGGSEYVFREEDKCYCHICKDMKMPKEIVSHNVKKGWKMVIESYAARYRTKLILSHATEIIATAEGYEFSKHRNYIPPKPEFEDDQQRVIERFRQERLALLDKYLTQFGETGRLFDDRDNMDSYSNRDRDVRGM